MRSQSGIAGKTQQVTENPKRMMGAECLKCLMRNISRK